MTGVEWGSFMCRLVKNQEWRRGAEDGYVLKGDFSAWKDDADAASVCRMLVSYPVQSLDFGFF